MDKLTFVNATHHLHCAHAIGRNRNEYTMRCHVLKEMKDRRLKVLVFGDRYWKGTEHISKIRYVSRGLVTEIETDNREVK